MHPIKRLRKLLHEPKTNQGTVIQNREGHLLLATPKGSLSVMKNGNDATTYRSGDQVILANGVVVGRRIKQPKVYVV